MRRTRVIGGSCFLLLIVLSLSGCQGDSVASPQDTGTRTAHQGSRQDRPRYEVIETLDRTPSFTQGLELLDDGTMVHSRGRYGESGIDILSATGAVVRSRDLPDEHFGEGLTVVPGVGGEVAGGAQLTAYQLTWKSGVVHTWSVPDLVEGPTLQIDGDGWGLCYDDARNALWQSDGSSTLRLLALPDLAPIAEVSVTEQMGDLATPVQRLNELECDGGRVWANIWQSDDLLLIEPPQGDATGWSKEKAGAHVVQRISLTTLVEGEDHGDPANVLNGIAVDERDGTMLVTGKNWEHIFRIALLQG